MEKKVILSSDVLRQIGAIDVTPGLKRTDGQSEWSHSFISVIRTLTRDVYHCEGDAPAVAALLSAFAFGSVSIVTPDDDPSTFSLPKWLTPAAFESNIYPVLGGHAYLTLSFEYQSDASITAFRVETEVMTETSSTIGDGNVTYKREGNHVTLTFHGNVSASDKVLRGMIADINLSEANMMFICTLTAIAGRCFAGYEVPTNACFEIDLREVTQIASDQPANIVALDARKNVLDYFFNRVYRTVGVWTGIQDANSRPVHASGVGYVTILSGGKRQERTAFCFNRLAAQAAIEDQHDLDVVDPADQGDRKSIERGMEQRIAQALPGVGSAKVATLTAGVLALATMFDETPDGAATRSSAAPQREDTSDAPTLSERYQESMTVSSDPEQTLFETTASRRARTSDQNKSSLEQLLDNEVFFS